MKMSQVFRLKALNLISGRLLLSFTAMGLLVLSSSCHREACPGAITQEQPAYEMEQSHVQINLSTEGSALVQYPDAG